MDFLHKDSPGRTVGVHKLHSAVPWTLDFIGQYLHLHFAASNPPA